MALVLADRVKETTTTTGTGTITLAGASVGFQSFAVIGNANTTYYTIVDSATGEWEVGIGTYTLSGTTLSRDTVLSNSLGTTAFINFAAGIKDVFVTYPAGKSVYEEGASGNVGLNGATPSAWGSIYSVLEYEQGVFFGRQATNNVAVIGTNLYNDGTNWRYKQAAASGLVTMSQLGLLTFFNAPSGAAGAISPLAAQFQVNAVGDLLFNSGYGSAAVAYGCRAWVNFNGTGTVAIRASGNVSSITDGGVGIYTVNFTTAMPNANYSANVSYGETGNTSGEVVVSNPLAASVGILVDTSGGSAIDRAYVYLSVFR